MKTQLLILFLLLICFNGFSRWERQYPQPTENDLYDSFFVDDNTGWVVGGNGIILHTEDGGRTWDNQVSGTTLTFKAVCFIDHLTGWIAGGSADYDCIILNTTDGGNQWNIQLLDATTRFRSIYFIDEQNGWVVGDKGVIYHTNDAGNTWMMQICGSGFSYMYEVQFTDLLNGWIATNDGLYNTYDGGLNWNKKISGRFESVFCNSHLNGQPEGWASASGIGYETGKLLHSTDSFTTWDTLRQCSGYENGSCGIGSIFFKDAINGWMISWDCYTGWWTSCSESLLKTQDGGNTWEYVPLSTNGLTINNLSFTPDGKGCIVGDHGLIMTTTNWNDQWITCNHGNSSCLYALSFPDDMDGWAVGPESFYQYPGWWDSGSAIIHTSNGGVAWNQQNTGIPAVWKSVDFIDSNTGWAAGHSITSGWSENHGFIIHTDNGGADWMMQRMDSNYFYNDVFFIDELNGWAVGYYYNYPDTHSKVLRTKDGGNKWEEQDCNSTFALNDVYFIDSYNGWIVGSDGAIYLTVDGGLNWRKQPVDTEIDLLSVHFTDSYNGWVVGSNYYSDGIILHTTDGGYSWQQVQSIDRPFKCVYFKDHNNGLISGSSGTILLTTDGGKTWQQQESGTTDDLFAVCFTANGGAYASGAWGTVLHTPGLAVSIEQPRYQVSSIKYQIYPNPSFGISDIRYQISDIRYVTLEVYDITGQKIKTLVHQEQDEGEHSVQFNGSDFPAGVYFVRLQVGESVETQKLILINNY